MSTGWLFLFIILFPIAFILHDGEEIITQEKWMSKHKESLLIRFPRLKPMIEQLAGLSTKAFAIAALEELLIILLATLDLLLNVAYSFPIWSALFIAFSFHLLIHIGQAIIVRGYIPGIITTILCIPYAFYGVLIIGTFYNGWELVAITILGIVAMLLNLKFAHWLGKRIAGTK